jgi:hypothetical protein
MTLIDIPMMAAGGAEQLAPASCIASALNLTGGAASRNSTRQLQQARIH